MRDYIERTIADGRRNGYVSTILGRRRYMPGLTSGNYMLRAAAEREATNAPLQGSAADLMKLAMVHIDAALATSGLDATLLLQIHDELIFEVAAAHRDGVAKLVRSHMEHAIALVGAARSHAEVRTQLVRRRSDAGAAEVSSGV